VNQTHLRKNNNNKLFTKDNMSENLNKPLQVAIIGAGVRGTNLARKLSSSEFRSMVVAVAEPDDEKRKSFAKEFNLPDSATFTGWVELSKGLDNCDAAIIATLDNQHTGPAIACLQRGWHILVEKPLADSFEDCLLIVKTQDVKNTIVAVCHTLRFMEGFRKVKQILDSGTIGQIIHIEHLEGIGNFRFAHNYVRGRWAQEKNNTFLLLHKCSHDIDYINWLIKEPCERVSSFGSLKYFTTVNAPDGSTYRCVDNCSVKNACPYSALRIYVDGSLDEWPARDICNVHTREAHIEAIKNGPYGICVWHVNNDVVDHQVVMMEFTGGTTATCTLSGYSATNGRRIRLQGTHGEMLYDEAIGRISIKRFSEQKSEFIKIPVQTTYHPEDKYILDDWISSIVYSTPVAVDSKEALRTHAVVFASEISRKERRIVEMTELQGKINI
jgi:predicted dehydrogenase